MRAVCKKSEDVREQRREVVSKNRVADQIKGITQKPHQKAVQQRITESKKVAELFYLLNETNWNKFDDKFFLVNRKWFDRWKDFISYDYIVKLLVELRRPESEISVSRVLSNNSNPGEISNNQILLDLREQLKNRSSGLSFCNKLLRKDIVPERDLVFLSEPIWKFIFSIYGGAEVRRFAIT